MLGVLLDFLLVGFVMSTTLFINFDSPDLDPVRVQIPIKDLDFEAGPYISDRLGLYAHPTKEIASLECYDETQSAFRSIETSTLLRDLVQGVKIARVSVIISDSHNNNPHLAIAGKAFSFSDGRMPLSLPGGIQVHLSFPDAQGGVDRTDYGLDGKTGLSTWDASVCLAQYFAMNPGLVEGKAVIELGAGTGLVGISSAFLGATRAQLTDLEYALGNLRENVKLNAMQSSNGALGFPDIEEVVEVQLLDWFSPPSEAAPLFDVIVAADVAWLDHLVSPLVNTIKALMSSHTIMYLAHQTRSTSVDTALFTMLRESYKVEEVVQYHPDYASEKIKIFTIV